MLRALPCSGHPDRGSRSRCGLRGRPLGSGSVRRPSATSSRYCWIVSHPASAARSFSASRSARLMRKSTPAARGPSCVVVIVVISPEGGGYRDSGAPRGLVNHRDVRFATTNTYGHRKTAPEGAVRGVAPRSQRHQLHQEAVTGGRCEAVASAVPMATTAARPASARDKALRISDVLRCLVWQFDS